MAARSAYTDATGSISQTSHSRNDASFDSIKPSLTRAFVTDYINDARLELLLPLQTTDGAERQGSLLRLRRRKAFIKCGEIGGGVSQERGRETRGNAWN